jgi:hypothetical protein
LLWGFASPDSVDLRDIDELVRGIVLTVV